MTEESNPEQHCSGTERFQTGCWQAPPCRIRIITGQDESWVKLARPFALIGSDPCCEIRIGGSSSIPRVAYFVCCLPDCIEVWPTAAIAFPRWGAIRSDVEILVGRSRITVHHPLVSDDDYSPLPHISDCVIETSMIWQGAAKQTVFHRPVTLIGETHPSVLRLHGRGLKRSHFAAVVADQALWIVDISAANLLPDERVRCIRKSGDQTQIGDGTIQFVSATDNASKSRRESPSAEIPSQHVQTRRNDRKSAASDNQLVDDVNRPIAERPKVGLPRSAEQAAHRQQRPGTHEDSTKPNRKPQSQFKKSGDPAVAGDKSPPQNARPKAKQSKSVSSTTPVESRQEIASESGEGDAADKLASELADRMVLAAQSKKSRFRWVKLAMILIISLVAGLVWITMTVQFINRYF